MKLNLIALYAACAVSTSVFAAPPPLAEKAQYKVGFAQSENNNPWRIAETDSFKNIAKECGWQLIVTDASGSASKQVSDVNSMIAQRVDVIFLPPREERPLVPAVKRAKARGIPVFLVDRKVDETVVKPGEDYVTFIGSDFIKQGEVAAELLVKLSGGKGKIIQLEGTTGSTSALDHVVGFNSVIAKYPDMEIVASQTGDYARDKGRKVMETLLQTNPDVTMVWAHNDEMALGAIRAIEAAGLVPGKDIIVGGKDGTRDGLQAIIDGKMAFIVESTPKFGPLACETMKRYASGEKIEPWVKTEDRIFDASNAAQHINDAF
ncbi:ABC transporter substrate-binding protein [Colwellia echini]|uniref:ABC transporter substrate-binding protein n=1 Tax=Colwellia echini TaxID=1982103 RepID=A0ABY3N159_9GAMM|nr:ABC transporter substrate-binding protein [Colwellia echini]TYK67231.1 ABC transporter substrate-binding protein [Colwellia echini]